MSPSSLSRTPVLATRWLRAMSFMGWTVVVVGVAALGTGVWRGWAEFLGVAAVALLALISAVPFILVAPRYSARIELASDRVVVGERAVGRVAVRNSSRRTSPSARLELPVGAACAEFRMPRLDPGSEHDELFAIPTQRRTVLTLGPITSVRSDPLGLLRRSSTWSDPQDLYVHPRVVSLESDTAGIIRDLEGTPTQHLADDDINFHALREYAPGDDLRYVHWRSTARTGTLMMRQFEQTRRSHLVLALSTRLLDYADEDECETAISVAGSMGVAALRTGKALTLLTSQGSVPCPTRTGLLDGLAAIDIAPGTSAPGLVEIARTVGAAAPNASVVALIAGSTTPVSHLRAASVRLPGLVRALGLRVTPGVPLTRHTMGDFVYADVPSLEELRRGMRAVNA